MQVDKWSLPPVDPLSALPSIDAESVQFNYRNGLCVTRSRRTGSGPRPRWLTLESHVHVNRDAEVASMPRSQIA